MWHVGGGVPWMWATVGRRPMRVMMDVDREKEDLHGNWNEVKLLVDILISRLPKKSMKVNTDLSFNY